MTKKTVICGATGLVGSKLAKLLHENSHELILVGRNRDKIREQFSFNFTALTWDELSEQNTNDISLIINLAGAGVSDKKWTKSYMKIMRDSRLETTQQCVDLCKKNPKIRLINASAVSAYGFYNDDHAPFSEGDEDKRTGSCFLQELIDDWEVLALKAKVSGNPVVLLRIGVVLDKSGGALPEIAKPYYFYMGGPAGSGKQIISWISLRDLVAGINFIINHPEINGPVNMVSPGACTQNDFSKALGKALGKPSVFRTPTFMINALMGQMGKELILSGQRVIPKKLQDSEFTFKDIEITNILNKTFKGNQHVSNSSRL